MNESIVQSSQDAGDTDSVLRLAEVGLTPVENLLSTYGLSIRTVAQDEEIPGSFWGDEEAGLIGNELIVRADTPLHSILHETCHYICLDKARREAVHTNAGGDYDEENAVCYLQILLADHINDFGRDRMFLDMDRWGYTFRLGSARAWFERDAEDARAWLVQHGLVNPQKQPCWTLREN